MKLVGRGFAGLGLLIGAFLLAGCQTDDSYKFTSDPLVSNSTPAGAGANVNPAPATPGDTTTGFTVTKGNSLTFTFSDTPQAPPPIDTTVQEDGSVTLLYNERFQADGKTVGALQEEVRSRYVPKYFKYLTVTIKNSQERWYYVGGEVRAPGRQVYSGRINLLQAIDTAGGFTDYSRKGKVQVTRASGKSFYIDSTKALTHPEINCEIYPGDKVQVPKRIF